MNLPIVQARITNGLIGVNWSLGQYNIRTKPADLSIRSTPATVSAPMRYASMSIDMTRTHEALTGGNPLTLFRKLQSQMSGHAAQNIQKVVHKWDQIGNIADGKNAIPGLAKQGMLESGPDLQLFGPATPRNIDIHWDIPEPDIHVRQGGVDVQVQANKPKISYYRGTVDVYMKQKPSVDFSVQHLDVRV
jgi:hypothetical protein